jgi:hypothetical protein
MLDGSGTAVESATTPMLSMPSAPPPEALQGSGLRSTDPGYEREGRWISACRPSRPCVERYDEGISTALMTCTIPLAAEMSVAAIPAAVNSDRVSVSPLSIW